ncbi:MAG: hypothetical protein C4534_06585 [Gaiellales bacterium]|nr:MAG: hypothetical protein C4534_06585 [Gaiellales bacterium]
MQPAEKIPHSRTRYLIVTVLLAALAVRVLAAMVEPMIQLDETVYAHMAESLNRGLGPMEITGITSVNFMPAYPFFIAALATVLGNYILAGYCVSITFGVLVVLLTFVLARDLAGERVGLMAAALMAAEPLFLDFSARLYSESTYMFFLLAAVIFGRYMLQRGRLACAALGGGALGIAYLLNPVALFYLMLFFVLATAVALCRQRWVRVIRAMAVFIALFLVFAVPYLVFLHENLDRWAYTGKNPALMYNAEQGIRSGSPEWDRVMLRITDDGQELFINTFEEYPDPVSRLVHHPVSGLRVFFQQMKIFYFDKLPLVFPLWLLPFLGVGLFGAALDRQRAAGIGYLLLMMTPGLLLFNVDSVPRYFLPYVPFAIVMVAIGWARTADWAAETLERVRGVDAAARWGGRLQVLVGVVVIVPLLLFSLTMIASRYYPLVYKEAGLWINQEYGRDRSIMSREYAATYYADGHVTSVPYAGYDATYEFAKLKGVELLVIGEDDIRERLPMLKDLLGDAENHPGWRHVRTFEGGEEGMVHVFELVRDRGPG